MERLQFISMENFGTASGGNGSFNVSIQTVNALTNVMVTLAVTGMSSLVIPAINALNAYNQLTVQLQQYTYTFMGSTHDLLYDGQPQFTSNMVIDPNGFPVFSSQLGLPTFRMHPSEHIISVFSECDYILQTTDINSGIDLRVAEVPLLGTIADAQKYGPLVGLVLSDVAGTPLTNDQIASLIEVSSAQLIAIIGGNRIVTCTFVQEESGWWQRSFFLRKGLPGIFFDGVWAKRPYTFSLYGIFLGGSASIIWNYNRTTGELAYIPSQNCFYDYEPPGQGNEIKISYCAGNYRIPKAVQNALYQVMSFILENNNDIKSLKNGTWQVTFKDESFFDMIRDQLSNYILGY